jgi:hypothetical protein
VPKAKVFHSFSELLAVVRFEASKTKGGRKPDKPARLNEEPNREAPIKARIKGRVNTRNHP